MGMYLAMACINHKPLKIWLIYQSFKQSFPYAAIPPTNETPMSIAPAAEVGWQITPRRASTHDPKHGINTATVVVRPTTPSSLAARQKWL